MNKKKYEMVIDNKTVSFRERSINVGLMDVGSVHNFNICYMILQVD